MIDLHQVKIMLKFTSVGFILLFSQLAYGAISPQEFAQANGKCMKDAGIEGQDYMKLKAENKKEVKCFFVCVGKALGAITNNDISQDKVVEIVQFFAPPEYKDQVKQIVTECFSKATGSIKENECEYVSKVDDCVNQQFKVKNIPMVKPMKQ